MPTQHPIEIPPVDEFNRQLIANVRPSDWRPRTPAARYDLVVIGAGTAGLVAAAGAAGLGARVALVERKLLGGDCLNHGCVPSKALLRAARAMRAVYQAAQFGIDVPSGANANFPEVMRRLRRIRSEISRDDSAARFQRLGVDLFFGRAAFANKDTVTVDEQRLRFNRAMVATGARARVPEIPGLSDAGCFTNETIFELTELPRRLAVLGAGPVGCELAQAFARLGAETHLIQRGASILPRDEPWASTIVADSLAADGVRFHRLTELSRIESTGAAKRLYLQSDAGPLSIEVDAVLVATGRVPNVDLNLESAGIGFDAQNGIHVDDFLRTSNRRVYAAGDVCSRYKFTHAADAMARIVVQNALFLGRARTSQLVIPWCTYTDPELAHIGLTERQATEQGIRVDRIDLPLSDVHRALLDDQAVGQASVLVRAGTDQIAGATIVAAHAGDMEAPLSLAMTAGLGLKSVARTILPYPTQAEAVRKLAEAYNRTRLTPRVAGLLRTWLRWRWW